MDLIEMIKLKNISVEDIDRNIVPDIEDIKRKGYYSNTNVFYESRKYHCKMQLCRKRKKFRGLFFILFEEESNVT
ncbi:hypothetical protein HMPREF1042_2132 [Streptococcus constellatus subsp. pharyngis SK1060 = CCUG 46377]|uniref:Uncharacterized protein n=1 Tax=Streptococcus constellatus subsp. pharyngis SK1060 = CCUG 46377 TaxID=1035184 RepID=F9PA76_STRCV|nr:hypothetical protein HMPREF1042_2132 [Streptococcus constellatus subsp. pharyngis SK1060 = CCUG 46377]